MAICVNCESDYSDKRLALGYKTCLTCGEKDAQVLVAEKANRVFPAGNKQAYTLLSGDRKQALWEVGFPIRK